MRHEHLVGTGDLYEGDRIVGRVRYVIDASSPMTPADPLGDSSGDLELIGGGAVPFFRELGAGTLTLHLEDGRRWPWPEK